MPKKTYGQGYGTEWNATTAGPKERGCMDEDRLTEEKSQELSQLDTNEEDGSTPRSKNRGEKSA